MNSRSPTLIVNIARQELVLQHDHKASRRFAVSTGTKGAGEVSGSECTPRGWHYVRAKIGTNQPINTVFIGRRPSGEIYTPEFKLKYPHRDWILTRILWLSGLESGFNRLGEVDTMRRYIYIHGCPDDDEMGRPGSHGCIKMHNQDVMTLYDAAPYGTKVYIEE